MIKPDPEKSIPATSLSEGWLTDLWCALFGFAGRLSVLILIRWLYKAVFVRLFTRIKGRPPKITHLGTRFVDGYVAFHTFGALLCLYIATLHWDEGITPLLCLTSAYGVIRVFDIFCNQVNVLLFDRYRALLAGIPQSIKGYRRMVILIAHNYWEMVAWFGIFYLFLHRYGSISFEAPENFRFLYLIRQSMLMMLSYNTDLLEASTSTGLAILSVHSMVGLMMTVVIFARFLSLLPAPDAHVETVGLPEGQMLPPVTEGPGRNSGNRP